MSALSGRRGSLGIFLAGLTMAIFLTLPVGITTVRLLDTKAWLMRSAYYLDELLPQAYFCLDPNELAAGRLSLDPSEVDSFLRNRMAQTLPGPLRSRMVVQSIEVHWLAVPQDPEHWLKDRQPGAIPEVRCQVRIQGTFGQAVSLTRSIELIQMPE